MKIHWFIYYKDHKPYVCLSLFGKTFRIYKAVDPKFYRYGLFIKYGVRGWDRRLPPIVHNMTKWYYTRKLRKEYDF